MNDIVHRSLVAAKIPARLEPSGLQRSDGKRPDGVTVVPWGSGKLLTWDVTCPDTFAPSYTSSATSEAGAVAALAEGRKQSKYTCLEPIYSFTPVAIESSRVCGPLTLELLKDLGRRLSRVTGEDSSYTYLLQRLSVAVQRGNSASILGTLLYCILLYFIFLVLYLLYNIIITLLLQKIIIIIKKIKKSIIIIILFIMIIIIIIIVYLKARTHAKVINLIIIHACI